MRSPDRRVRNPSLSVSRSLHAFKYDTEAAILDVDDQEIRNAIVETMLNKRVIGGHKKQVQTIVSMALPSHAEGRGKELMKDLVQAGVVQRYGGSHRANVRLTSADAAVAYLEANDGDVPFGFE